MLYDKKDTQVNYLGAQRGLASNQHYYMSDSFCKR